MSPFGWFGLGSYLMSFLVFLSSPVPALLSYYILIAPCYGEWLWVYSRAESILAGQL